MKNKIPCLKSKLFTPELPDNILLSERIRSLPISKERTVIITAPGGYGKTTAVLLSLEKERPHIHWYRLEKEDGFLPVFYTHFIETLFGSKRETLDCCKGLSSVSNITDDYPLLNALICQDAWQFFSEKGPYHYIVLDDYQNVSASPIISETVRYFIANMPPGIGIVVMSRVETGIISGKLALNKTAALITREDLRFTRKETEELLHNIYGINFTPAQIDQVHECAEGWVAGLFMISHTENPGSLFFNTSLEPGHAIEQTLFSHFFSEFLQGIDSDKLEALADMSILSEFTCDDLREIFHIKDPFEFMQWLERNNLYIQKFMPSPVRYRFHSLFRRELKIYLDKTRSKSYIRGLYARAADYYHGKKDLQQAIRYYVAGGQTEKAVNIMAASGAERFAMGQPEEIMYLTREFPERIVQADPYLLFYRGLMLLTSNIDEAYNCFRTALLLFKKCKDMSYLMNAFGMILVLSFQTNDFKYAKDAASLIPKARVVLSSSIPRNKLLMSGFINMVAEEKFPAGIMLCKLMKGMKISEPIWDYSFLTIRAMLLYRTGRLKAANEILPQILSHPAGLSSDQWRAIGLVGCHNTLWLSRDIKASKKIMEEFAGLGEKYDSDFYRSFAFRLSAITKYQTRDVTGAIADMEEVANCYVRYASPILAGASRITKYLWETEISTENNLAEKAEAELMNIPKQDAGHGYYELCQGMVGAVFKAAGNYDKAEPYLLLAYNESLKKKARQHMCSAAMHLADLYFRKRNGKLSDKYLMIWAKESSKKEYVFFHEMDYRTLVRACALAAEKEVFPQHMRTIIALYFGLEHGKRMADNPSMVYSDPESFIAGCLKESKDEQIIKVTLLGNFSIERDGFVLEEKEWKTRKVSGILKYILANPEKSVTRESLATLFWPDSDSKAAFTSLRVALYELRKKLARFGMGFNEESALIVEDKSGFRIGNGNLVKTDAQEFLELYNRYKSQALTDDKEAALLVRMTRLYTGDFLENSPHDEWVDLTRERYKSIFIEVSQALSKKLINKGALKKAEELLEKHVALDPYDETGCQLLVRVYKATGQKARANAFFRQFKKRFRAEMGMEPNLDL